MNPVDLNGGGSRRTRPSFFVLLVLALAAFAFYSLYSHRLSVRACSDRQAAESVRIRPAAPAPIGAPVAAPEAAAVSTDSVHAAVGGSAPSQAVAAVSSAAEVAESALAGLLSEAGALESKGALVEARQRYMDVLKSATNGAARLAAEAKIGRINIELVMTPRPMPEKVAYTVASGDSLARIVNKFGTTKELATRSNGIQRPDLIKAGDLYRILNGKFTVTVSKTRNDLLLDLNGAFFKRYSVGTGKYGKTPAGTFVIAERIAQPPWYRPDGKVIPFGDKENILGTHWLSLKATGNAPNVSGYGIHGTWDESTIGKPESSGCIRLRNADVEELYLLLPIGTPVTIEE